MADNDKWDLSGIKEFSLLNGSTGSFFQSACTRSVALVVAYDELHIYIRRSQIDFEENETEFETIIVQTRLGFNDIESYVLNDLLKNGVKSNRWSWRRYKPISSGMLLNFGDIFCGRPTTSFNEVTCTHDRFYVSGHEGFIQIVPDIINVSMSKSDDNT